MNYEDILNQLNEWCNWSQIVIPQDIEFEKELKYIQNLRNMSNDGYLCGPLDVKTARKALQLESEGFNIDFSFEGGINDMRFFNYWKARTINVFEKTHDYYNKVREYLKEIGSSEKELDNKCFEYGDIYCLNRDLDNFIFSNEDKDKIKNFLNL